LAQGAWAIVLSQYSGQRDVVFGVTVAGRPAELEGLHATVGLFINTLPLRVALPQAGAGDRVREWLRELQAANVRSRQFEQLPLVDIQAQSEVARGEQLFHSLFVFENAPLDRSLESWGSQLRVSFGEHRTHTNYPLTVVVIPGQRAKLVLSYDARLFSARDMERMLKQYRGVLLWLSEHPEGLLREVPTLLEEEQREEEQRGSTARGYRLEAGYAALFEEQVARAGERLAVQSGAEQVTYVELDERAEAVGFGLQLGAGGEGAVGGWRDGVVALLQERGIGLIASMIGAFKVGAGYVALDAKQPAARMREVLELSGARVVVVEQGLEEQLRQVVSELPSEARRPVVMVYERLLAEHAAERERRGKLPRAAVSGEQLAYVIYTSGSTGKPKGAMVTVAGMLNNQLSKVPYLGLGEGDVVAQTASQSFDISVWQSLAALLCGGRVEVIGDEAAKDAERLLERVKERGVTVLESVPSLIGALLTAAGEAAEAGERGGEREAGWGRLRVLMPTGEALSPELARQWLRRFPEIPLVNAYGPAECADDVALHRLTEAPEEDAVAVPIGSATDNHRLYVLDGELRRVAVGVVGEICVAGVGVGRGYLGEPGRTAEVFVPNPYGEAGERLYRTGDMGRWRWDGTLEYVGRRDQQVKVRGYRIELGEIEARLRALPRVKEAAVQARASERGGQRLVGYVVFEPRGGTSASDAEHREAQSDVGAPTIIADERAALEELERGLGAQLPEYMVPQQWMVLDALPLSANGKLDRRRLPEPEVALERPYRAPETAAEQRLAALWQELLRVARVGLDDHFFELGGDSIVALQLVSRAKRAGLSLAPRDVFERPRLHQLARAAQPLESGADPARHVGAPPASDQRPSTPAEAGSAPPPLMPREP
ncbi:MAG: amino acid adenylation domain-containing protein, partial [Longimicrobiaceae bacterium]